VHPAGYGFVATEAGETVFVPAKYRGTSLDGDRVAVDTWPGVRGTEGRVSEVLARGRARLTGILRRVGRVVYLEPDDPRISSDYGRVGLEDAPLGKDGDAIVIEITRYPDAARRELGGKLLKVLGDPEDPRTEIEKILACAVIPIEFPDEANDQARRTSQELGAIDLADRIDLRDRRFATIDPETARDFDDALCIEDGPHGGPRVWVAVADVSHYVRWDDALDKEAAIRGVSVYLPDRVIPMLPHQLSAGICSLNLLADRWEMVVRLDYTEEAEFERPVTHRPAGAAVPPGRSAVGASSHNARAQQADSTV
jgi:ribonuclease R